MGFYGILMGFTGIYDGYPSGKRLQKAMERSSILQLGKSTISMAMFKSYVTNYQRVAIDLKKQPTLRWIEGSTPCSHGDGSLMVSSFQNLQPAFPCTGLVQWPSTTISRGRTCRNTPTTLLPYWPQKLTTAETGSFSQNFWDSHPPIISIYFTVNTVYPL